MPLDVLIATPSGPFGELIRLTLEVDPEFHCSILDNGGEIRSTLQNGTYQAVIFDCSFPHPEPRQVVSQIKDEFPSVALLLAPPENRQDITLLQGLQADGLISRLFDASVLPDMVKTVIQNKTIQSVPMAQSDPGPKSDSWWTAFQTGIQDTAASSGMIVQNGMVIACTPDTSTALQQQVTASVMRFWNPADLADLMRYVKDLVTGQEWMMYASQASDNAVLVLLFLPQTPVTKVRAQTLKLAKEISVQMSKPAVPQPRPEIQYLESSEPPRLHEILGEKTDEGTPRIIKNGFPVEWFKEADLPEFNSPDQIVIETSGAPDPKISETVSAMFTPISNDDLVQKSTISTSDDAPTPEIIPLEMESESSSEIPLSESTSQPSSEVVLFPGQTAEVLNTDSASIPTNNLDLGNIQPVDLIPNPLDDNGLDSMQAISLETKKTDEFSEKNEETTAGENLSESGRDVYTEHREEISKPQSDILEEHLPSVELPFESQSTEPLESTGEVVERFEPSGDAIEAVEEEIPTANIPGLNVQEDYLEALHEIESLIPEPGGATVEFSGFDFGQSEKVFEESPSVMPILEGATEILDAKSDNAEVLETPLASPAGEERLVKTDEIPVIEAEQEMVKESVDDLYTRMNELQSSSSKEDSETYTVALIPRSESMILQRQTAGSLNQAMTRLCLAFNWKLENLTIRPTYMQWTVTIPISLSPDDMIGIVRKETTLELSKTSPDNPLIGDLQEFWASESMSATGKDFTPSIRWQNFILRRKFHEIA